jgi:hypothetical protein
VNDKSERTGYSVFKKPCQYVSEYTEENHRNLCQDSHSQGQECLDIEDKHLICDSVVLISNNKGILHVSGS